MRRTLLMVSLLAALCGCNIEVAGAQGKLCQTAFDCPDELSCVQARGGAPKTCEALALPQEGDFASDAGVAFYCNDVKPILDTYCVACHGSPPAGGAPATSRFDVYETTTIPGAKDKAEQIYVRSVVSKDMPPGVPLSPEEQRLLTAWYRSGAPLCADGDGGTPDANGGMSDGGDGG